MGKPYRLVCHTVRHSPPDSSGGYDRDSPTGYHSCRFRPHPVTRHLFVCAPKTFVALSSSFLVTPQNSLLCQARFLVLHKIRRSVKLVSGYSTKFVALSSSFLDAPQTFVALSSSFLGTPQNLSLCQARFWVLHKIRRFVKLVSGYSTNFCRFVKLVSGYSTNFRRSVKLVSGCSTNFRRSVKLVSGCSTNFRRSVKLVSGYSTNFRRSVKLVSGCSTNFCRFVKLVSGCSTNFCRFVKLVSGYSTKFVALSSSFLGTPQNSSLCQARFWVLHKIRRSVKPLHGFLSIR